MSYSETSDRVKLSYYLMQNQFNNALTHCKYIYKEEGYIALKHEIRRAASFIDEFKSRSNSGFECWLEFYYSCQSLLTLYNFSPKDEVIEPSNYTNYIASTIAYMTNLDKLNEVSIPEFLKNSLLKVSIFSLLIPFTLFLSSLFIFYLLAGVMILSNYVLGLF